LKTKENYQYLRFFQNPNQASALRKNSNIPDSSPSNIKLKSTFKFKMSKLKSQKDFKDAFKEFTLQEEIKFKIFVFKRMLLKEFKIKAEIGRRHWRQRESFKVRSTSKISSSTKWAHQTNSNMKTMHQLQFNTKGENVRYKMWC
jgi:hypothetical protein